MTTPDTTEAVERHLDVSHNHEAGLIPVATRAMLRALAAERDQWASMVGHIVACLPLKDIVPASATMGQLIDAIKSGLAERDALRADNDRLRGASDALGSWMSAALDDPNVCEAMKSDINNWFAALDASK